MTCDTMQERLTARLSGELSEDERLELEAHLVDCAACADHASELDALWRELGRLPEEEPGPRLRARFEAMLAEASGRAAEGPIPFPAKARAVEPAIGRRLLPLAATLILGLGLGYLAGDRKRDDVASLTREVGSLREMVTLSLLEHDSVSERLKGVSYGRRVSAGDDKVVAALFTRLLEDDDVNVRLAAVEALRPQASQAGGRHELLAAVLRQDSPLVELALIDVLLESAEPATRPELEQLAANPKLDPTIRGYLRDRLGRSV